MYNWFFVVYVEMTMYALLINYKLTTVGADFVTLTECSGLLDRCSL